MSNTKNTCYFLPFIEYIEEIKLFGKAMINHHNAEDSEWPTDLKDIQDLKEYCEGQYSEKDYIVSELDEMVFVINEKEFPEDSYVYEISKYEVNC